MRLIADVDRSEENHCMLTWANGPEGSRMLGSAATGRPHEPPHPLTLIGPRNDAREDPRHGSST